MPKKKVKDAIFIFNNRMFDAKAAAVLAGKSFNSLTGITSSLSAALGISATTLTTLATALFAIVAPLAVIAGALYIHQKQVENATKEVENFIKVQTELPSTISNIKSLAIEINKLKEAQAAGYGGDTEKQQADAEALAQAYEKLYEINKNCEWLNNLPVERFSEIEIKLKIIKNIYASFITKDINETEQMFVGSKSETPILRETVTPYPGPGENHAAVGGPHLDRIDDLDEIHPVGLRKHAPLGQESQDGGTVAVFHDFAGLAGRSRTVSGNLSTLRTSERNLTTLFLLSSLMPLQTHQKSRTDFT